MELAPKSTGGKWESALKDDMLMKMGGFAILLCICGDNIGIVVKFLELVIRF